MRFFFLKRAWPHPSGGHKHIRLLASCLNELGVQAQLVFVDGTAAADWSFDIQVPIASFGMEDGLRAVQRDDVVVLPENNLGAYLQAVSGWPGRKAVLNQNGYYALQSRPAGGYARHGVDFVIATTPFIASLAHAVFGMERRRILSIPCLVDLPASKPAVDASVRVPDSVCYMPRKLPDHIQQIRSLVAGRFPRVHWRPIVDAKEGEVARVFRQSGVFLSTQDREGFGLPAVEAMSCGCVVAGYSGSGRFPHPYATKGNGFWAPDRSIPVAADSLCRALDLVRQGGPPLRRLRAAGQKTAKAYSRKSFEKAVQRLVFAAARNSFEFKSPDLVKLDLTSWREIIGLLTTHRTTGRVGWSLRPSSSR
jgi:hypothetical protein